MICLKNCKRYCEEGKLELIENYKQAIESDEMWVIHHRDEIRILPSGIIARRSKTDLIEANRYYNCPPEELIFLSNKEHKALHSKYKIFTKEEREKISLKAKGNNNRFQKGHKVSEETRAKISKSRMGLRPTEETRKKLSISHMKKRA